MRNSKNKNLNINTTSSNSNCFTSILQSFTCGGNLPSPTPSDRNPNHHTFPSFKSNGSNHPNPIELPESNSTSSRSLDHNPRQPGLVARLMGLESMPSCPDVSFSQDSVINLRSKSLNSLHLYIFPDTFLDHVSPSPQFSHHQRRKPCHRRVRTSSSILCEELLPLKEKLEDDSVVKLEKKRRNGELSKRKKVDGNISVVGRKKDFENKVIASKSKVSEDHSTRKCGNLKKDGPRKRKEIKHKDFGTRLRKEEGVHRIRNVDKPEVNASVKKNDPLLTTTSKDDSTRLRRRSSRKIKMSQCDETYRNREQNSTSFQGKKKVCSRTRTDNEDCLEMMVQVCRLAEEYVREDEWIDFDDNVKELSVDFAAEILEVSINQFLDELLG